MLFHMLIAAVSHVFSNDFAQVTGSYFAYTSFMSRLGSYGIAGFLKPDDSLYEYLSSSFWVFGRFVFLAAKPLSSSSTVGFLGTGLLFPSLKNTEGAPFKILS